MGGKKEEEKKNHVKEGRGLSFGMLALLHSTPFQTVWGVTFMQVKNLRYPLMLGSTEHAWESITYGKATHISPQGRISVGTIISI